MNRMSLGIARRLVAPLFTLSAVVVLIGWGGIAAAQSSGLVAAYSFSEGTGTTVADVSGNGNNGTIGAATWTSVGKYGNALVFNGTSALVTITDAASLHVTTGMTLEAWVNLSTVNSAWRDVIYKGNNNYYLEASSDHSSVPAGGGTFGKTNAVSFGTAALALNTWTHLAVTYNKTTLRLYVNGVQVASQAQKSNIKTSTNPLQIGGDSIFGHYFQGTIDEVRIYNVPLTAAQIQSDMNTPLPAKFVDTQPPTVPSGLTASAINNSQINLSWTASTDNVGVTGYLVERSQGSGSTNFSQVGTPTGTSFGNTGLAEGTVYNYRVRATDAAGNLSGYSSVASATTGSSDTQSPTAPSGLTALAINSSQINLSWTASTDNVGVTGYLVERSQGSGSTSFSQVGTPTGTSFNDAGLAGGTIYNYRVRATDAAGNLSGYSSVASATTAAASGGLVAAYSFNEGIGTTVADVSGNGNNGTVAATTWSTAGKYGSALVFNGTSARVTINDSASLHLTTAMTLEAWVNPSSVNSTWRDVIYKGNDNYYLEATSDQSAAPGGGGTFGTTDVLTFGTGALVPNAWTHLATTYDGTTLRLYVNGVQVSSRAQTGNILTSTNPLQIGGDSIFGQYFQGMVDEVRVYNVALTAAQIQSDMSTPITTGSSDTQAPTAPSGLTASAISSSQINLSWTASTDNIGVTGYLVERSQGSGSTSFSQVGTPTGTSFNDTALAGGTVYNYRVRATDAAGNLSGYSSVASATTAAASGGLVAAYSFDEGTGTAVTDASGNGNNGTISGATWASVGKYGSALVFNGTSARVTVNDSTSLHLTTGMTLEAWVNPSTVNSAWRDVIYKGNDNYYLEATSDQGAVPSGGGTFGAADVVAFGTAPLTLNTWTHLAITYDGATMRLYLNGASVVSGPQTGNILTSTNPLQIGGDSIFGQYFQGMIDEVRVYNVALTAAQIQSDMNAPVGNIPTPPGNLTATPVNNSQVNLSWTASTDRLGVTGYLVERQGPGSTNFVQIGTSTTTNYSDTGLTANTNYSYRVRATDGAGNLGPYSNVAQAYTGLAISPQVAVLTVTRTQQFTVNFAVSVNWSVDGVVGGSASAGTITTAGLYSPPNSGGTHTVTASTPGQTQTANATVYVSVYPGMFTFHNDNFRSGQNLSETALTPANVNSATFGKLFSYTLDGMTFASPLYVANVNISGKGFHNVVFVETEHDSVYAFDADGLTNAPLWQRSFINPAAGVTTVPAVDTGETGDIPNEIGITGTPVIAPASGALYVVAKTKEVSGSTTNYVQRLHALDITTGAEKLGGPVVIQGSVAGTGLGSSGGQLVFNSLRQNQRTGLLLANGVVYFGFSSHGDHEPFHGWVMGYNATTLQQVLVYCSTRNGDDGGIWMNGDGLAVDATGNLYFITGDGLFDANTGGSDYGDSFVKINSAGTVLDYFSPSVQSSLDVSNLDLGSGGVLLLPDQSGAHPHEMVSAGKNGTIYLVDRDNMGHYNPNSDQVVQSVVNIFTKLTGIEGGNFSSPVYFNGSVYFSPVQDNVQAFQLSSGLLSTTPTSRSSETYGGRGGTMAISANGSVNGILWTLQSTGTASAGILHAYDAGNLGNELYNSSQAGSRDTLDVWSKFSLPLVANGKVFISSVSQLTIYGLLP